MTIPSDSQSNCAAMPGKSATNKDNKYFILLLTVIFTRDIFSTDSSMVYHMDSFGRGVRSGSHTGEFSARPKPSPREYAFLKAARQLLKRPFAPTLHEIADLAGLRRGSIDRIVKSLINKGYVIKSRKARSLQL